MVLNVSQIQLLNTINTELIKLNQNLNLGLSLIEIQKIKEYFSYEKRNPNDIELHTISQTWSEHCYHKTFKGKIQTPDGLIQNLLKTFISKGSEEKKYDWCLSLLKDNAGIIEFNDDYAIAAKVETHNHPSAIEPFGGAATGVGGVIRDILGVWASPIANMNVLGFGPLNLDYKSLPPGVNHPNYIFNGVVSGIGNYGNNMGIPTVNGAIVFDESYTSNVVVYCGCIGILPKKTYVKSTQPDDIVLLIGGKTGPDGIHGVTFASTELNAKSKEISRPAVQIANPIEEEKLKRAIIKIRDEGLGSNITDLGGGGLSSAINEMAFSSNCGVHIKLDTIPLRITSMSPWEIWISESQERMLLSIPKKNLQSTLNILNDEDVEATPIGEFTSTKSLIITLNKKIIADINLNFLFNPPLPTKLAKWTSPKLKEPKIPPQSSIKLDKILHKLLSTPTISSKESVIRTYDHEVQGNTVIKPLQGIYSGPNDAAVVKPLHNSWKGISISCGINPQYGKIDPYWMAASSIDESIRNNIAVGGTRFALLDNFTWGNPDKPDRLGSLIRACQACYDFGKIFEAPFISGKDSLYNESVTGAVTPTLLITTIGIVNDIRKSLTMDLKSAGNLLYIVGETYNELGGSEYYRLHNFLGKNVPKVHLTNSKKIMIKATQAIKSGLVKSCHDVSEGGIGVATAEMAFTGNLGLELYLDQIPQKNISRDDTLLFSESNSRFLMEVPQKKKNEFEEFMNNVSCNLIGYITNNDDFKVYGLNRNILLETNIKKLRNSWKSMDWDTL